MEAKLYDKASYLASRIIVISQNTLLLNLRFMDSAIFRLSPASADTTFATDGQQIYYGIIHVLKKYKNDRNIIARDILHMILHCVFRHLFIKPPISSDIWDLATDIAVENCIISMGINSAFSYALPGQIEVLNDLKSKLNTMNAEKIYRYYMDQGLPPSRIKVLRSLFKSDDHSCWYEKKKTPVITGYNNATGMQREAAGLYLHSFSGSAPSNSGQSRDISGSDPQSISDSAPSSISRHRDISGSDYQSASDSAPSNASQQDIEQEWENVSKQIQMDLETFSKQRGEKAGNLIQQLSELNREKYDYSSFLRKFAVMTEVMKVNDEEFDYIFYTYGLNLYGNIPLIEPLEYKDEKRIREFVIAIDTSGSVMGETVQRFVEKTYNILKSTETFSTKINLHIIQCDTKIQEHVKITNQDEFDKYIKSMTVKGLGGTDFRPVFEEINSLIDAHELVRLKGMIYFTDGYGVFPEKKPSYETAFVFLQEEYNNLNVPPWAMKLILSKEEILADM